LRVLDSLDLVENVTRWLGVAIAILGSLVINPAATETWFRQHVRRLTRLRRNVRAFLARFIPALRQDINVQVGTVTGAAMMPNVTMSARGLVGWGQGATVDEKIDLLDKRTTAMFKELGELQAKIAKAEQQLQNALAEAIGQLRREARDIMAALDAFKEETVHSGARALPVIVVGVVVAGLAPDADWPPLWVSYAVLVAVSVWAVRASWRIYRDSRLSRA
jgi:hypothetical protein